MSPSDGVVSGSARSTVEGGGRITVHDAPAPAVPVPRLRLDAADVTYTDYYASAWVDRSPNATPFAPMGANRLSHRCPMPPGSAAPYALSLETSATNLRNGLVNTVPVAPFAGSHTMFALIRLHHERTPASDVYSYCHMQEGVMMDSADGFGAWLSIYWVNGSPNFTEAILGTWAVIAWVLDVEGNDYGIWVNGQRVVTYAGTDMFWGGSTTTLMVGTTPSHTASLVCDLAEFWIWDGVVPSAALDALGAQCRAKWGLTNYQPPAPLATVVDLPAALGAGLVAWLDAADPTTLFADAAGTVPAVPNGAVRRWLDRSGNGFSVLCQDDWNSTTLLVWDDVERIHDRRVVSGYNTLARYDLAAGNPRDLVAAGTGSATRVMVFRLMLNLMHDVGALSDIGVGCPLGAHYLCRYPLADETGATGWVRDNFGFDSLREVFDLRAVVPGLAHRDVIVTFDDYDADAGTTTYRVNSLGQTAVAFQGAGGTGWCTESTLGSAALHIDPGMFVGYTGQYMFVAECFMWNRVLSTTERQDLRTYLTAKWGVSIAD